jgi:hypothetical protein
MKLRIADNSIRLRLTRGEITALARSETVEGRTALFPQPFVYQLAVQQDATPPTVSYEQGRLRVTVPWPLAERLASTDEVGIEATIAGRDRQSDAVHLLIEKDFKCLHGSAENQEDCFANPLANIKK